MIAKINLSLLLIAFSSFSFANKCIDSLANNQFEPFLVLSSCHIEDKDMGAVVDLINANPKIEIIYLNDNKITDQGVIALSTINHPLPMLNLSNNAIQGTSLGLLHQLQLDYIQLENNPIDDEAVKQLLLNKHLQGFYINGDLLTDEIASIVTARKFSSMGIESNAISSLAWNKITTLSEAQYLTIGGKNIDNSVGEQLGHNRYVQSLGIYENAMDEQGFTSLFSNTNISELFTSGITERSVFLKPLAASQSIKTLYIDAGNDAVLTASVGQYFKANKSIRNLVLKGEEGNAHKAVFDADFAKALSKTQIEGLYVINYEINDKAAVALAQSEHLNILYVMKGQISDEGAVALGHTASLRELSLPENRVTDKGALSFIENDYLVLLDLCDNPISKSAAQMLLENSKIKDIFVELPNVPYVTRITHYVTPISAG